jgi:hypothetical protein
VRDLESIDDELSLVAEVRLALRQDGCDASTWQADHLLDERLRVSTRRALLGRLHLPIFGRPRRGDG